jgi:hypothetical protein
MAGCKLSMRLYQGSDNDSLKSGKISYLFFTRNYVDF